jgi:hypothetical protein
MIVYKLTDGFASDLRYEDDRYILKTGERSLPGWDPLPNIETLHEPAALEARDAQEALRRKRVAALRVLEELRLDAAMADPNAPVEVKEYAQAKDAAAT